MVRRIKPARGSPGSGKSGNQAPGLLFPPFLHLLFPSGIADLRGDPQPAAVQGKHSILPCERKLRGEHRVLGLDSSPGDLDQDLVSIFQRTGSVPPVCKQMEPVFCQAVITVDPRPVLHKGSVDIFYDVPDPSHADRSKGAVLPIRSRSDLEDAVSGSKDRHGPSPQFSKDQFIQCLHQRIPGSQIHGCPRSLHPRRPPHG